MMDRDFSSVKRIVVKVGTNLLSDHQGIDAHRIEKVVADIVALRKRGAAGPVGLFRCHRTWCQGIG